DYEQSVYRAFSGRRITTTEIKIVGEDKNSTRKSCVPSIAPAIVSLLFLSDHCSSGLSGHVSSDVTSKRPAYIAPGDKRPTNVSEQGKSVERGNKSIMGTSKPEASTPYYYYSSGNEQQHHFRAVAGLSSSALDCAPGFSTYIEATDGIEAIGEDLATFQIDTSDVCLYTCSNNK
ncbi:hypothetical protein WUBG_11701, partial [Wuchereria bancrofti]